jgi:hypothetical protein
MTMTLKDIFKEFEDKVEGIHTLYSLGLMDSVSTRPEIVRRFGLVKGFILAQQDLENRRDLWLTTVDLLKASKAFNDEIEEIREELLEIVSRELEKLNKKIIRLQLHTQKTTTVKGNSEKANKPDTTVKGNAKKANKPDVKFNWQGEQTQLVYLIEQLYEQGFLSPISQPEKHRLTAQHFTVKGKSLNHKNLAKARDNYLNNKGGKPKGAEKIDQIISDAEKKQNPSKT